MKLLYIINSDLSADLQTILDEQKKVHSVQIIDLRVNKNWNEILDTIEKADRVISWQVTGHQ